MRNEGTERFVIVAPQATAARLKGILAAGGFTPDCVFERGEEAVSALQESGALVVTIWKLADMTGAELASRLGDDSDVLMIVPQDFSEVPGSNVVTLRNPISPDVLIQAVRMLHYCRVRMRALHEKADMLEHMLEDRKLIDRAKGRLMDSLHISEAEAHRRIQKHSMDTGRRIADVAREILEVEHVAAV